MLDELLDALDALDTEDVKASEVNDILLVCAHPVFKLLVEFCEVFGESHHLRHHHGHKDRHCETNPTTGWEG